jgi:hypothetical protein
MLLMTPNLLTFELALQRQAELRRLAAPGGRRSGAAVEPRGDGDGFFATFLSRIRTDAGRIHLGPTSVAPCYC